MFASVSKLFSYPVKGLSPLAHEQVELCVGEGFPFDRMIAFARADGKFDPYRPARLGKSNFLQLMKHERLAGLQTHLHPQTLHFVVRVKGRLAHRADLSTAAGRVATASFFATMLEVPNPEVACAQGLRFTDESETSATMMNAISLINVSSVNELAQRIGGDVDPLRFRANIYVEGWPAFSELGLIDRELLVGSSRLRVVKATERCAATEVNPANARRDLPIPRLLMQHFGHALMGIYVQVVENGAICPGDRACVNEAG